MGWTFPWFSSGQSDFNFDYGVSFTAQQLAEKKAEYNYTIQDPHRTEHPGVSVLFKDDAGRIFHDEGNRGPYWVRRHDEYDG
jgi:predicted dithiol-disulfide oxidoreductase (DUF899 family)